MKTAEDPGAPRSAGPTGLGVNDSSPGDRTGGSVELRLDPGPIVRRGSIATGLCPRRRVAQVSHRVEGIDEPPRRGRERLSPADASPRSRYSRRDPRTSSPPPHVSIRVGAHGRPRNSE